ncbi:16408_t:CDS:2 [Entrophospora sp. SA101]|nr:16408_t:CDS:2 [Entrophospora sp. SA101]
MDEFVDSIYEEQREQGLIQEISSSIKDLNCDNSEISANNVRPNCDNSEITRDFETQDIICLYQNACVAEKDAIEANQSEISCWCLYAKRFKGMVKDFMINDEIGEKKVKEYTDDQNDSDDLPKIEVNLSQEDGSTARNFASLKLPEAEVSIPTSSHLVTTSDNKSLFYPMIQKRNKNMLSKWHWSGSPFYL